MLGSDNVATVHARAIDYAFQEHFKKVGEYEAAYMQARVEADINRLVHKPVKVATPFQLLKWLFGIPRFEIGLSEMVGGLFIFDEIHAYDPHVVALIVEMVRILKQLGGRMLFMSATFPSFLKVILSETIGHSLPKVELQLGDGDDWTRKFLQQTRHYLRLWSTSLDQMTPCIVSAAKEGKRVLVVANRVTQAQELYRSLSEKLDGVHLLHSRFTRKDRTEKERVIMRILRGQREEPLNVLVATQVVEVSLDVSFDTIFTEIAPVDDLLQRFGRVNRYGEHPEGVDVNVAAMFDTKRLKQVYEIERLHCTRKEAPPDNSPLTVTEMQAWVERVYKDGWTEKEKRRFRSIQAVFQNIVRDLRPLYHSEEGTEDFRGLFKSVEVLPRSFYEKFCEYFVQKRYLLADQLLVPIHVSLYNVLRKSGRLTPISEGRVLLSDVLYDPKLGLMPNLPAQDRFIY